MDMPLIGFTIGDVGTVRDRQSAQISRDTVALARTMPPRLDAQPEHWIGEYVADYSPLAPGDLIDADADAELEAMLAASTVVRCNEGV